MTAMYARPASTTHQRRKIDPANCFKNRPVAPGGFFMQIPVSREYQLSECGVSELLSLYALLLLVSNPFSVLIF